MPLAVHNLGGPVVTERDLGHADRIITLAERMRGLYLGAAFPGII
jgi:hypothetical protein